jgi:ABC-type cobalamin/Fe3+-siderophores transport system ATPase subunit
MKIVSLTAENIKKLTAVHIRPNGNLVEITGKNGQGKSSVLDSIWWAITGSANIQAQPIRKGEQRASIKLDLGEIIVTRNFVKKLDERGNDGGDYTTSLSVRGADGSSFKSPQSVLDGLAGVLSFDPLAFAKAKSKDQFDSLSKFVPGIDFEKVDAQNRGDYERRTEVNRLWKQAQAAADMILIPPDTPEEPIDEAAITTELKAAGTLNADVQRRTLLREQAAKDVESHRAKAQIIIDDIDGEVAVIDERFEAQIRGFEQQIAGLQRQIESAKQQCNEERGAVRVKLTSEAAAATADASALQERLNSAEPLPAVVDVDAIEKRLNEARVINANVERARQRAVHFATAKKYAAEAEQLSQNIDARNQAKKDAIAAAKMPVPGLDFGDGVVLLNGVPFEQASDAERLRASVAIAMAANPKLRVIRIRDGSLLDEDAMKLLEEMANQHDMQVWIERVDSSGQVGFVLEDGHVRDAAAATRSAA